MKPERVLVIEDEPDSPIRDIVEMLLDDETVDADRAHAGEVTVKSRLGSVTTFRVKIPVVAA